MKEKDKRSGESRKKKEYRYNNTATYSNTITIVLVLASYSIDSLPFDPATSCCWGCYVEKGIVFKFSTRLRYPDTTEI